MVEYCSEAEWDRMLKCNNHYELRANVMWWKVAESWCESGGLCGGVWRIVGVLQCVRMLEFDTGARGTDCRGNPLDGKRVETCHHLGQCQGRWQ